MRIWETRDGCTCRVCQTSLLCRICIQSIRQQISLCCTRKEMYGPVFHCLFLVGIPLASHLFTNAHEESMARREYEFQFIYRGRKYKLEST